VFFVAAAGNDASENLGFPAGINLPNVYAIAASDSNDVRASFSNF
jgi:Subtilase family